MNQIKEPSTFYEEAHCAIPASLANWRVLLVDDDENMHVSLAIALENATILGRSLELLHAYSTEHAQDIIRNETGIAVAYLAAVMESKDACFDLVRYIREKLGLLDVRIILLTGQSGCQLTRAIIQDYDINDYRTKSELTSINLYVMLTAAIGYYAQLCAINANRQGLEMLVSNNADLMVLQDVGEFASLVLLQTTTLFKSRADGLVCTSYTETNRKFRIEAAAGRFAKYQSLLLADLDQQEIVTQVVRAIETKSHACQADGATLFIGARLGAEMVIYLANPAPFNEIQRQLLTVLCANIADCLDNVTLLTRLRNQAYFDQHLGLPNRIHLVEKIQDAFATNRVANTTLAVLDIDHFSAANDAYGQLYGDRLLREIASRLTETLGPEVVVARVAGDTFGLLGDESIVNPAVLRELFRTDVTVGDNHHPISATFGLARLTEIDTVGYAIQDAGIALKRAKLENKGHCCYYTRNMGGEVRARVRMMQKLRGALGAGGLFLHYQPQIDLQTRRPVGGEALLRWRTEDGQLIQPDQFIPLAESSGLIIAIGDWVLRSACKELVALNSEGITNFRMAVNISVVQFRHVEFVNMLKRIILETGVDPTMVELEITESVAMQDPERIVDTMNRVKSMGLTIAIDDFGTGFSSLAYLQQLPVDRLKIDRGFVNRITPHDGKSKNIAEMIIDLGRNLGLKIIAEGVEDEVRASYLADRGCHEAQGFLIARPGDGDVLRKWWKDWGYSPKPTPEVTHFAPESPVQVRLSE